MGLDRLDSPVLPWGFLGQKRSCCLPLPPLPNVCSDLGEWLLMTWTDRDGHPHWVVPWPIPNWGATSSRWTGLGRRRSGHVGAFSCRRRQEGRLFLAELRSSPLPPPPFAASPPLSSPLLFPLNNNHKKVRGRRAAHPDWPSSGPFVPSEPPGTATRQGQQDWGEEEEEEGRPPKGLAIGGGGQRH